MLAELRELLHQSETVPLRQRRKMGRTLGHMAMELEKADALKTAEEMDIAIRALALGAGVHSYPQRYQMSRARLMQRRREYLDLPEPEIAYEKARTLDVEAGAVFVSDAAIANEQLVANEPFHETMNRLGFFAVGLGGDGLLKVRIRIHQTGPCEPQSSEFRRLREATCEARVACSSGALRVTGFGRSEIVCPVAESEYRAVAFGLGMGRKPECLILLSPIVDQAPAKLSEAPELLL